MCTHALTLLNLDIRVYHHYLTPGVWMKSPVSQLLDLPIFEPTAPKIVFWETVILNLASSNISSKF